MKYIIKNCPAYRTECEEIFNFLGSEKIFNACLKSAGISCKDITDCVLKRIVELLKVDIGTCDRCDGVGYFEDCEDTDCCFYRIMKIQELLEIEEVDEK